MAGIDIRELQILLTAKDQATKQLSTFGDKLTSVGKNAQIAGKALIAIGAVPTAVLVGATKTAIDFESAFAGVRKTVDASEAEFAQLEQNFRNISKTVPLAVNDLNRVAELAGQLGVQGVDNITKFTETIAKIAITTNLTTESASTEFARLANIMQEPLNNVDRIGASIVDLGNNFATTEAEISAFSTRLAGAGKIAGLSTAEVLGIGTALSSVGVEAQIGGTAVQKVLIAMTKASAQGGEELEAFAQTAGMSAEEFAELWQTDASTAFTNFVEGLGQQGDEAFNTLETLGLADQRLMRAFLSLANAGDLLSEAVDTSTTAWEENTALNVEAEKRFKTTASQLQIVKNNLSDVGLALGQAVLPHIVALSKALVPLISKFAEWAQEHPNLLVGILAVGAGLGALGGALFAVGTFITLVAPALPILAGAFATLSSALLALNPVVLAVVAVIGLLFLAWQTNFLGIQDIFNQFIENFKAGVQFWIDAFMAVKTWIEENILPLFQLTLPELLAFFLGLVVGFAENLYNAFVENLQALPEYLTTIGTQAKDNFVAQVKAMGELSKSTTKTFIANLKTQWGALPEFAKVTFTELKNAVVEQFKAMWDLGGVWINKINDAVTALGDKAHDAINAVKEAFRVGRENAPSLQFGGFVPDTGLALLHKGEFVLSRNMLEGRTQAPSQIQEVFNQPININANITNEIDLNMLGDQLAFALRNTR